MRMLAAVPVVLFMLVGPALADPTPVGAPIPLEVTVHVGGVDQTYRLATSPSTCATAEHSTAARYDHLHICARDQALDIDWESRVGTQKERASSSAIIAPGASFEAGTADAHVTVKRL